MTKTTRKSQARKMTFIILAIFILIATIGGTYSRYTSTGSGTGTADVAKWAVKINNADITTTNTFNVTFNEVANANVVDGKIAPASSLYADFVIDPTGSEVAIDYDFVLGAITASGGATAPSDIAIEKVVPVTGATISGAAVTGGTEGTALEADANGKYTGTITLASQSAALSSSEAQVVRVYIKWTNNEEHNTTDTSAGKAAPTLSMQVTGTAKQHI